MQAAIPFPEISPEIFSVTIFGIDFALRWYALAYIAGILVAWRMVVAALKTPSLWPRGQAPMTPAQAEDLLTWIILGIVVGGRLGFVLFYQPDYYLQNPMEIFKLWEGGMAFHGGLLGVVIATSLYVRAQELPAWSVADVVAFSVPPGLFFGRVANFINAELWGRPTDAPWGVTFPTMCSDPVLQGCRTAGEWFYTGLEVARHPSQIYQAGLEGLALGALLIWIVLRRKAFFRPGLVFGTFLTGYGIARFIVEYFRQADPQFITQNNPMGYVIGWGDIGVTMGQVLSLPMVAIGLICMLIALRRPRPEPA